MEDNLENYLNTRIKASDRRASLNYSLACVLLIVGLIASVSGFVSAALEFSKWLTAMLAALPGAVLYVNSTIPFEARAQWHWKIKRAYERLHRDVKFTTRSAEDISHEITHLETELATEWPVFGNLTSLLTPGKPGSESN